MTRRVGICAAVLVASTLLAAACSSSSSSHASPVTGASTAPASTTTTAGATTSATATTACDRPHAPGRFAQSFRFQGNTRTYQLYVPRKYTGTAKVPVVFDFHGFGSNAIEQMFYGNFMPEADRDGFLIVAPDGQGAVGRHFVFTSEPGKQNDVLMVGALLDHIEATFCVDAKRVYSTGMSDGGAMTAVLACVASNRFAAFGAVAVIIYVPLCDRARPVPIMAFSGTADPVVPFNGGKVSCCGGSTLAAAPTAMANWAKHNMCSATFSDTRVGTEVTRRTWPACAPGSGGVFYIIEGGGHTWPGALPVPRLGKTTNQIDASATIWAFFKAHPLR